VAREPFDGSEFGERGRAGAPRRSPRRAAARAHLALFEAVRAERAVVRNVKKHATQAERRARDGGLLAKVLVAVGSVLVLAGAINAAGGLPSIAFSSTELNERPGKAVASPFEAIHAAQKAKIREAMNAPFVLGVPRKRLETIAECESHGDPRAIGGGGLYRGKYQFHRGTWASVGGTGDPARASELEQDRRAAMLIKQSGSNPWPNCG
jgi:hypothetical protein